MKGGDDNMNEEQYKVALTRDEVVLEELGDPLLGHDHAPLSVL